MKTLILLFGVLSAQPLFAQEADHQPIHLIGIPTGYGLAPRTTLMEVVTDPLLVRAAAGVTDYLTIGLSYGGKDIIGWHNPQWYPHVEIEVKFKLLDDPDNAHGVAVGYDSQGYGAYLPAMGRYQFSAKSFYLVGSRKVYPPILQRLTLHFGVNGAPHNRKRRRYSVFTGIEAPVNSQVTALVDYDAGLNDLGVTGLNQGRGYFNLGVRCAITRDIQVRLSLWNVLNTQPPEMDAYGRRLRTLGLLYIATF